MSVETTEVLRERASIYRLLAQLYRHEVKGEIARRLVDTELLKDLAQDGYDLEPAAIADADELAKLGREYTRIFLGPGKHVAPYGSVHHPRDLKKGQLWGSTTTWVRRFASDHGMTFEGPGYDGIPDHIGHELEFFSKLMTGQADALDADDDERAGRLENSQRHLYEKQLSRWVPVFCNKVRREAQRPFYGELARLTQDLLDDEGERVGEVQPT